VNDLVLEQCAPGNAPCSIYLSLSPGGRAAGFAGDPQVNFLDTDFTGPETFSGDMLDRVFEGFTVTFVALQLLLTWAFMKWS